MDAPCIDVMRVLIRMLVGDPLEAMEAAKKAILLFENSNPVLLAEIAANKKYKKWSRIGAVYALGFLASKGGSRTLLSILSDRLEPPHLRSHAAEALGNLKEQRAVRQLTKILADKEPPSLKRWCVYALSEIGGKRANLVLKQLEAAKPRGAIGRELRLVGGKARR